MVDIKLVDLVIEVKCKSECSMAMKVVVGSEFLNGISVHAPQIGLVEDIKSIFGRIRIWLIKGYL